MRFTLFKWQLSKVHACSPELKTSTSLKFYRRAMSGDYKPSVFSILGAPGSGKGTQCSKITEKFSFEHLSAGDLLRNEKDTPGSPYGALIAEHIKNGTIVPAKITCCLLERGMHLSEKNFFLIDGFPRNFDNLQVWEQEMSEKVNFLGVLFFDCDEEICFKRCLQRGAAGSGRTDDNENSLRKRFLTYKNDTIPVLKYFQEQKLVYKFNCDRTPDEIFKDVDETLQELAPLSIKF